MSCLIAELHRRKTPFAVIISKEITGTVYSILYHDRFIRSQEMDGKEINYFLDMRQEMKLINFQGFGSVWEYNQFKKKMSHSLRHNFLVRNQIIKGGFI
jgi:hypothetical protein